MIKCRKCGAAGHWSKDCPTNSPPPPPRPQPPVASESDADLLASAMGELRLTDGREILQHWVAIENEAKGDRPRRGVTELRNIITHRMEDGLPLIACLGALSKAQVELFRTAEAVALPRAALAAFCFIQELQVVREHFYAAPVQKPFCDCSGVECHTAEFEDALLGTLEVTQEERVRCGPLVGPARPLSICVCLARLEPTAFEVGYLDSQKKKNRFRNKLAQRLQSIENPDAVEAVTNAINAATGESYLEITVHALSQAPWKRVLAQPPEVLVESVAQRCQAPISNLGQLLHILNSTQLKARADRGADDQAANARKIAQACPALLRLLPTVLEVWSRVYARRDAADSSEDSVTSFSTISDIPLVGELRVEMVAEFAPFAAETEVVAQGSVP
eukprot:RCo053106